jgi:hypothetical protein
VRRGEGGLGRIVSCICSPFDPRFSHCWSLDLWVEGRKGIVDFMPPWPFLTRLPLWSRYWGVGSGESESWSLEFGVEAGKRSCMGKVRNRVGRLHHLLHLSPLLPLFSALFSRPIPSIRPVEV